MKKILTLKIHEDKDNLKNNSETNNHDPSLTSLTGSAYKHETFSFF